MNAPASSADNPIESKVANRQFFACTRAEPIRSSQTWAAR